MKTTHFLPLFLSALLSHAQSAAGNGPHTTECKTTKSDTNTWSFLVASGTVTTPNYAVTVEHQTLISPCTPIPTAKSAAGEEPNWDPYTATQILTRHVTYNSAASRKPASTTVTNTWVNFPVAEPYARLTDLRPNCDCSSSARSETEDKRCAAHGAETKCGVQCGGHGGKFTCLVESTDDREFLEGRVCVREAKKGQEVVHLGEPCHVGDVMNECSICSNED